MPSLLGSGLGCIEAGRGVLRAVGRRTFGGTAVVSVALAVALLAATAGPPTVAEAAPRLPGTPTYPSAWVEIDLPNISDRPEDPNLRSRPPYTIRWGGEGTTSSGKDDCDTTPPYRIGRRAVSDRLPTVKGIVKRGEFRKQGSGAATDGGNHLAFFFHQNRCFDGGAEYGLTRKLNESNATLYLYQCGNCNTGSEQYTRTAVWEDAGADRVYLIRVRTDGDFEFRAYKVRLLGGLKLLHSQVVGRAGWLPNLHGAGGYITANAHSGSTATPDDYTGSHNRVTTVRYLP